MTKNRLILTLGILTLVTPFLGIPNSFQNWIIGFYGLVLIFIFLFEYLSDKNIAHRATETESNEHESEISAGETFEESEQEFTDDRIQ